MTHHRVQEAHSKLQLCRTNVIASTDRWMTNREKLFSQLKTKADDIDQTSYKIDVTDAAGKGVSVIGACLGAASLAFPPLATGGAVMFVLGQITSSGATLTRDVTQVYWNKEINELIAKDQDAVKHLKKSVEDYCQEFENFMKKFPEKERKLLESLFAEEVQCIIMTELKLLGRAFSISIFLSRLPKQKTVAGILSAYKAVLFLYIPWTIIEFAKAIHRIFQDPHPSSRELRKLIQTLEAEYDKVKGTE